MGLLTNGPSDKKVVTTSNNNTECSICLNKFTNPKILPCFHTFCEGCLADHIGATEYDNKFHCRVCRTVITIPEGGVSKFQNNFYTLEDSDDPVYYCSKHKKVEMTFYCRDCKKAVCRDCVITNHHKTHDILDMEDVDEKIREELNNYKTQFNRKINAYESFVQTLDSTAKELTKTTDVACQNVDQRVEEIYEETKKWGDSLKEDMKRVQRDGLDKLDKERGEANLLITRLKSGLQHSNNLTEHKSMIPSIDMMPDMRSTTQTLFHQTIKQPDIRYPSLSASNINTAVLSDLLGSVELLDESTFTTCININNITPDKYYYSPDHHIINILTWYNGVKYLTDNPSLGINLRLHRVEDESIKSVTVSVAIKLINHSDSSLSIVKHDDGVFIPGRSWGWDKFIDWNELYNGYLDTSNNITIQTTVRVNTIHRKQ